LNIGVWMKVKEIETSVQEQESEIVSKKGLAE
jgi:hypothetical protein